MLINVIQRLQQELESSEREKQTVRQQLTRKERELAETQQQLRQRVNSDNSSMFFD